MRATLVLTASIAAMAFGGCADTAPVKAPAAILAAAPAAAPAASAPADAMPDPECIKLLDAMTAKVPVEESLTTWRRKGVRLVKPLLLLRTSGFKPKEHSGVVVRMDIGQDGRAILGTAQVLEAVGDPYLSAAMPTAIQGIQFDYTGMFKPPARFTFTTSYVACAE